MKPEFHKKILDNGMTVLFEKRDVPVVSVVFAVKCGGINEDVSEKGISHFIEHLLYKGTSNRSAKKIAEEIEQNGGDLNGFTDETLTAYYCKMPSKHLYVALDVLSDIVKNPLFDEKEVEKERQVIFEEIKMYKDNPARHVLEQAHCSLYEGTLGMPLIGNEETLSKITKEKIIERFKEVYKPNNMIFCVVGNANFENIVDFAEKNFSKDEGVVSSIDFSKKIKSGKEEREGVDQANFALAYHVPTMDDEKCYAALVLSSLMGGGMSSRLFQEIREKRNLAYAVKAYSDINKDFAYSLVFVGTKKENVSICKKVILDEFEKVSETLNNEELGKIKEQIIGNHYISMEDSQNQMVNLLIHEVNGRAEEFYDFEKNIKNVKLEDVKKLAKLKDYSFFALVPK